MARDYKHSARKPRKPPPTPPWVWMTGGFIAGLGVALGVHLYHLSTPVDSTPEPRAAAVPASETADDEQSQRGVEPEPQDDYSFYETLKRSVVQVPDETDDAEPPRPPPTGAPSLPTPGPAPQPAAAPPEAPKPAPSAGASPSYLVQTGSFRDAKEAEAMRASLGLLGLSSSIQQAVDKQNRTWHRVQVPAADDSDLARVRSLLEREDIDMMIIAQSD